MLQKPLARTILLLLVVAIGYLLRDSAVQTTPEQQTATAASPSAESRRTSHPLQRATDTLHQARDLRDSSHRARKDRTPLWTRTRTLTAQENAEAHWRKHRHEFPEYRSAEEYIEGAHRFLRGPPEGTEVKTRPNGDRLLYHPASNTFAVQARSGAPRTMFRPDNGKRYWSRQ